MKFAFMMFIFSILIIFLFGNNIQETFVETFVPLVEPQQFIDNCKSISKESLNIKNLLKIDGCNTDPSLDLTLKNRDYINKKINCANLVSKDIALTFDNTSYCSGIK
jgi:hypothetical protein